MRRQGVLAILGLGLFGCNGGNSGPPDLLVSATDLDFGVVPIQTSDSQTFTVRNGGGEEIEVLSVSLVAGNFDLWSIDREGPLVLAGDDELVVSVTFAPDREEDEIGQIQVRSDVAGSETVDLTGAGGAGTDDGDGDGFSPADGDCDDSRDDVFPGAPELCDGRDNNCDDTTPADEADDDSDGFRICEDDCDDGDINVYPGAPEICDDKDSDCDSISSDRVDRDGDTITVCDGDCDDGEAAAYPGAVEICDDFIDNDCDGAIDVIDEDGDGHSLCSASGDCDDENSTIHPLLVDDAGPSPGDGSEATPYTDLNTAIANVIAACPTIYVGEGTYEVASTITSGQVDIVGQGVGTTILQAAVDSRHFSISGGTTLSVADVTISGGAPLTGDGGAIDVNSASLELADVELRENVARGDGGAVVVSDGSMTVVDSRFTLNQSFDDGGAIALFSATMNDVDTTFTSNTARDGGGILASSSVVTSEGATIAGNSASRQGGGLHVLGASDLAVKQARIAQNVAISGGGGVSTVDVSAGFVRNSVFSDNDGGTSGGGIFVGGTTGIEISNNTLVANAATGGGGAIEVGGTSTGTSVFSNLAQANGGAAGIQVAGGATGTNNTCWQNTGVPGTEFGGVLAVDTDENFVRNPDFVDFQDDGNPASDDLTLATNSPAIDSGPTATSLNDLDGSTNDRGYTGGPDAAP